MLKGLKKLLGLKEERPGPDDETIVPPAGQVVDQDPAQALAPEVQQEPAKTTAAVSGSVAASAPTVSPEAAKSKVSWFQRLKRSLSKTRTSFQEKIEALVGTSHAVDEEFLEDLEEILIQTDLGVRNTRLIIDHFQEIARIEQEVKPGKLMEIIKEMVLMILDESPPPLTFPEQGPGVILVVGVNGVGKTTTIAKLAWRLQQQGKKVLLAAADTFRAGAVEQLTVWASRLGTELVKSTIGADAAAVAFDAVIAGRSRGYDVVIIDTAGRFHTKHNLMEELNKIYRVVGREYPNAPHEILLVLDATTGQNAVAQAQTFHESLSLTGIVLTKLDGTAKGGIVVAIREELKIPVKFIGIGEGMDDLRPFDPAEFVRALMS